jgi:Tol biopolymer transport system component
MRNGIAQFSGAIALLAASASPGMSVGLGRALGASDEPTSPCNHGAPPGFQLVSTIAFASTRDDPTGNPLLAAEIYLVNEDGTDPRRLTNNAAGDAFAALRPDGKVIVFDSNRGRAEDEPLNTSDLFVMNADGSEQTHLTRGGSATWSPDCKSIAFHGSASGTGTPIKSDPGAATTDSDIFVANVDDLLTGTAVPSNITNSETLIDDDPDWSPGGQRIVYTAHPVTDDPIRSNQAEIYVLSVDGTGTPTALTGNNEEERGPSWAPDGTRIVYACRIGGGTSDFEICVMNADGSNVVQLTDNSVPELTPTFSPDGQRIVFHRPVGGRFQLFTTNADGTDVVQLTNTAGLNLLANWGELRVKE